MTVRHRDSIFINFPKSLYLFLKIRPQVVVSTGAHTGVMMCYIARFFGKKVIWIESFANQTTKSASGKLAYPIATTFVVLAFVLLDNMFHS